MVAVGCRHGGAHARRLRGQGRAAAGPVYRGPVAGASAGKRAAFFDGRFGAAELASIGRRLKGQIFDSHAV